jgi:hypothetical protein
MWEYPGPSRAEDDYLRSLAARAGLGHGVGEVSARRTGRDAQTSR